MKSIELFSGAGGLAIGTSLAGFDHVAVIERDKWACDTIRENQRRGYPAVQDWKVWEGDVRNFDWSSISIDIDLLAGGPPCQPFSMGGRHKAFKDDRDMFPITTEVIRKIQPRAFIIENVKGLTRSTFANYYQYILLQLEFPEITRRPPESWEQHLRRLQAEKACGELHENGLAYKVVPTLVNAANYGVPQKRERVFIVGFRSDLGVEWSFPPATHSFDALLYAQWVTGEYWDIHRISKRQRPEVPVGWKGRIRKLALECLPIRAYPWRTVRDALQDIPDPRDETSHGLHNHVFQAGARSYKGHTGSPMDMPAKTLKAGDHGVPGGENMLVEDDGAVRYFSVRESARLQTFPDGYVFHGSWTETMRQLGNAVPVTLARKVAGSVAEQLAENAILEARCVKDSAAA